MVPDADAFRAAVSRGTASALAGQLLTFGITPTHPEVGYGYLKLAQLLNGDGPVRRTSNRQWPRPRPKRRIRPPPFLRITDPGDGLKASLLDSALSLQSHHHRSEYWIIVEGTAKFTIDNEVTLVTENQSGYILLGATHRMENPGKVPMILIEVQTDSYLGEDDIIRYEDVYARG